MVKALEYLQLLLPSVQNVVRGNDTATLFDNQLPPRDLEWVQKVLWGVKRGLKYRVVHLDQRDVTNNPFLADQ